MNGFQLSDRQFKILAVVSEGGGRWDARWIDITVNSRHGAGETTMLRELEELARFGFVRRDDSRSGVGGRWKVTDAAKEYFSIS